MRTLILTTALLAFALAPLAGQPPNATIRIDTGRVIGEVHPNVLGNFAEHLGRCSYGASLRKTARAPARTVFAKMFSRPQSHWESSPSAGPGATSRRAIAGKTASGPRDERPARADHAWGGFETNRFGTHEFLEYCDRMRSPISASTPVSAASTPASLDFPWRLSAAIPKQLTGERGPADEQC